MEIKRKSDGKVFQVWGSERTWFLIWEGNKWTWVIGTLYEPYDPSIQEWPSDD